MSSGEVIRAQSLLVYYILTTKIKKIYSGDIIMFSASFRDYSRLKSPRVWCAVASASLPARRGRRPALR